MLKLTRWTIAHRRFVVAAWVVLAVGVLAVSQTIGKRNVNNFSLPNTGSQHAIDLLQSHFPAKAGDVDQIVFRDRTGKLGDHSARAVIVPLLERIARLPHVTGVVSPYAAGTDAVSRDGRIGFASVEFDQRANELPKSAIKRVIAQRRGGALAGVAGRARRARRSSRPSSRASASQPESASLRPWSCCCSASARCSRWGCRS